MSQQQAKKDLLWLMNGNGLSMSEVLGAIAEICEEAYDGPNDITDLTQKASEQIDDGTIEAYAAEILNDEEDESND